MSESKDKEKGNEVLNLKNEITKLQEEINEVIKKTEGPESKIGLSEVMDLKRRVDLMEREFKKLSEALKNTLVDVRALVTELDNPFNMLRSIGVDKLLEKVMEKAEEEIREAKKKELSKRIAKKAIGDEDKKPSLIVGISPPANSVKEVKTEVSRKSELDKSNAVKVDQSKQEAKTIMEHQISDIIPSPKGKKKEMKKEVHIKEELPHDTAKLEETFLKYLKELPSRYRPSLQQQTVSKEASNLPHLFLVSSYLLTTLGMNNTLSLLSEYVERGWISAQTMSSIVSVMRMLSSYSPELKAYENEFPPNLSFEDHVFIISLLKSLEEAEDNQNLIFVLLLSKLFRIRHYLNWSKRGE